MPIERAAEPGIAVIFSTKRPLVNVSGKKYIISCPFTVNAAPGLITPSSVYHCKFTAAILLFLIIMQSAERDAARPLASFTKNLRLSWSPDK